MLRRIGSFRKVGAHDDDGGSMRPRASPGAGVGQASCMQCCQAMPRLHPALLACCRGTVSGGWDGGAAGRPQPSQVLLEQKWEADALEQLSQQLAALLASAAGQVASLEQQCASLEDAEPRARQLAVEAEQASRRAAVVHARVQAAEAALAGLQAQVPTLLVPMCRRARTACTACFHNAPQAWWW